MASRLLGLEARTPSPEPATSPVPSSHGAKHESELARRIAAIFARIAPRLAGISRMVAEAAFRNLFPGVPWCDEGNDNGRGTAIVDVSCADGSAAYGGHFAGFKSRVSAAGESLPSKNFDLFGPSPNVGAAVQGLVRLHGEGKSLPVICFFRTGGKGVPVEAFRVVAWAGADLPTLTADAIKRVREEGPPTIKGKTWGVFAGLPECPPDMPSVGRGGYPGVTVYVTHPDSDPDKRPNYRVLRVSLRGQTFDLASGEEGIARWLAADGFPTRARKR
jgi:hypothetical protein